MSWRAARSSTAVGARNDRIGNTSHLRSKTAVTKSRQDDKSSQRELFIGWDGQDTYLQYEPISIEIWGKRSSKPKTVPNTTKEPNDDAILPKEFYLCWTYTKCNTIEDYDTFVDNSLGSRFKPEEESNQPTEDHSESAGSSSATSKEKGTSKNVFTKDDSSNVENSEQSSKHDDTTRAIFSQGVTMVTEQSANISAPNILAKDGTTPSNIKPNPVMTLAESRLSTISQSSPNLRVLDKIEGDRRVSSAKSGRRLPNSTRVAKGNKDGASSRLSSPQVQTRRQNGNNNEATFSKRNDINESKHISSKNDMSKNNDSESVLKTCAKILETLRLSSPDRSEIGFELPQTQVSLGDILSSTPRLQRRLGTAKGRDPTVYAALHGKSPPPRPSTPDLKHKQNPRPPTPDLNTKLNTSKSGNKPDLIKDHSRSSPHQEGELPPVKGPRSPRHDAGSPNNRQTSMPPGSPNSSPKTPPKDFPPRDENGANQNGGKRTVPVLSYHKSSDTEGIFCSSNPDVISPDGSHGSISPRISENGDTGRNSKPKMSFFLQGTSAGLHQYSGPTTLQNTLDNCDDGRTIDIPSYENPTSRPIVNQTRGPPGFRPQGQKTPLHRAMENAHKKLYGQHYHLFTQTNYGQFSSQQERQQSAQSGSQRAPPRGQDPSLHSNTWPQQVEHRIKQNRSTTAPTRRMFHGTTTALHGSKTSTKRTGQNTASDNHNNSMHNRKTSAPSYLAGESGSSRRYSSGDFNGNIDHKDQLVMLRGRPVQR